MECLEALAEDCGSKEHHGLTAVLRETRSRPLHPGANDGLPLAPSKTLLKRFPEAVGQVLRGLGIERQKVTSEISAMALERRLRYYEHQAE